MRYNSVATLFKEVVETDERGNMAPVKGEPHEVFVNRFSIGMSAFMAAREAGLHADAEIQLRAIDYDDENIAVMDGKEYTVERVDCSGDFTQLTLARRLSNA